VVGNFAIWFFGFPSDEILGLGDGAGTWFVFIVAHGFLLKGL